MRKPIFSEFNLKSVKLLSGGGLDVQYTTETCDENGFVTIKKYHVQDENEISGDLRNLLCVKLLPFVQQLMNTDYCFRCVKDNDTSYSLMQMQGVENACNEYAKHYHVEGFKITGKDEKEGVSLLGNYICATFDAVSFALPKVEFVTDMGIELQDVINAIIEEVYNFLFEDKHGEVGVFGASSVDEDEADNN
jgi:hypothetical protein